MFHQNIIIARIFRLRKVFRCFRLLVTSSFQPQNLTDKNIRSMNDFCEKTYTFHQLSVLMTQRKHGFVSSDDVVVKCVKVEVAINRGPWVEVAQKELCLQGVR